MPDILILDEVLSAGDESFQRKCRTRMNGFRIRRTPSIIASHSMDTLLSLCERVIWLDHRAVHAIGAERDVISEYRRVQA
jgi:lipopolysaccharide transport system ATP-binding protein